jgi:serine/threonine protein phosphatase PrpC
VSFDIAVAAVSKIGLRDANEDCAGAVLAPEAEGARKGLIVAVADGVSSGGGGLEAAQTAVRAVLDDWLAAPEHWDTGVALDRLFVAHNRWLHGQNRSHVGRRELATTLTAAVLRGQTWTLAHVGDSRALLVRHGRVERLTTDHVRGGGFQDTLTRALGVDDRVLVDFDQGELQVHDTLVLLTDGAWAHLRDADIRSAVDQCDADVDALVERLAQLALDRGSTDNVTVLAAHVRGLPAADLGAGTHRARVLPVPKRLVPGDRLDGLEVVRAVADNGVNVLVEARRLADGRRFALKTLNPARAEDADERANLAHEGWLAQRIDSPHFAKVEVPRDPTALYLLYHWHDGDTLQQAIDAGRTFDADAIVGLARQALRALGTLHRNGTVHRDVKPANLLLGADGTLRLLDLGVAVSGNEPRALLDLHAGTPSYVNPEQWDGARADSRSDLFAIGVTLYQLATGKLPWGEVLPYQAGRYHRDPVPPTRLRPDLPKWLEAVILKAIQRTADERFETAEEFLLALERGAARPLPPVRPTPLLGGLSTGWQIALALSVFVNVMLVLLVLVVGR